MVKQRVAKSRRTPIAEAFRRATAEGDADLAAGRVFSRESVEEEFARCYRGAARRMSKRRNHHVGSSLDDFLAEDGRLADAHAIAIKRVLAWQLARTMVREKLSKTEMARRMRTSRAALDRLLDPDNPSVTLLTMDKAASVLGKRLKVVLVDVATFAPLESGVPSLKTNKTSRRRSRGASGRPRTAGI